MSDRADDKTAEEYNLEGGATLHLVLALRGGGGYSCGGVVGVGAGAGAGVCGGGAHGTRR